MKIQVQRFWRKRITREFAEIVDRPCCDIMMEKLGVWPNGGKLTWKYCPGCGERIEQLEPVEKEERGKEPE